MIPNDIESTLKSTLVGLSVNELAARTGRNRGAVRRIIAKARDNGKVLVVTEVAGTPYYRWVREYEQAVRHRCGPSAFASTPVA